MTNNQIIANEVITNGLMTENEVIEMFEAGYRLPFHTYAEWARMGYQVQKGSKAVIKTMVWKPVIKENEEGEKETKMIMVKAALFSNEQVAKIEAA